MFGATETPYDLRFRALGIPVRVHPMFWVVAAMLCGWTEDNLFRILIWIACVFLSILVHEYGHGLMARHFGASPSILLSFGGLCSYSAERQTPGQRLAVLFWGPGAGFVLCLATMTFFSLLYGITPAEHLAFVQQLLTTYFPFLQKIPGMNPDDQAWRGAFLKLLGPIDPENFQPDAFRPMQLIYVYLLEINIMWGILNLLPIWPLDGGQVSQTVLTQFNPYQGRRWSHVISLLVAACCALYIFTQSQSLYNALFFAYFAIINYQILDSIHRSQSLGLYDDDVGR